MDIANFEPSRGIEVKRAISALMIARRAASSDPKWLRSFCFNFGPIFGISSKDICYIDLLLIILDHVNAIYDSLELLYDLCILQT